MDGREAAHTSLDRIRIVLVEPKEPGNIGAVARAMKNMGLSRLYLVAPPDFRSGDARKMAHGSGDVLYGATVFETLEDALAGTALAVGTTHRKRRQLDLFYSPGHVAQRLVSLPGGAEGALVFGREERGLTNAELELCQVVGNIPTAHSYPSLNLAQAALLFAYELHQAALTPTDIPQIDPAPFEEIESMYRHIASALDKLGFVSRHRPETFMRSIRRLFGRIPLEHRDVATVHKIFRQVDKFISRHGLDVGGEGRRSKT